MTVDWEARDKKITSGQIKGNVVSNACVLYAHNKVSSLEEGIDLLLEAHAYAESKDVLDYIESKNTRPVKEYTADQHIKNIKRLKNISSLDNYRKKYRDSLNRLAEADRTNVKAIFVAQRAQFK